MTQFNILTISDSGASVAHYVIARYRIAMIQEPLINEVAVTSSTSHAVLLSGRIGHNAGLCLISEIFCLTPSNK